MTMKMIEVRMRFFLIALVMLFPVVAAAPAAVDDADAAVAARLADMGTEMLRQKSAAEPQYRACIALLKAAAKLNPENERYPRLMVEASLAIDDVDGAIAALKQYRNIMPDDQGAQLQLIELQMSKMETLDRKLDYANQILAAGDKVAGDVRSAVAVLAARMLFERDQPSQAATMLDQAIRLNPRNGEALQLRYRQGSKDMAGFARVKLLIEMIKANPLQPDVVAELSSQLAEFGLIKPSLEWYFQAMLLYQRTGQSVPLELAIEYGAEQFLAERYDGADGMAIRLLASDKYDMDALYLRLLCARNTSDQGDDRTIRNLARKTLLARLTEARDQALNPPSTTQPATQPALLTTQPAADVGATQFPIDPETGLPKAPSEELVELSAALLPDLTPALDKVAAGDTPEKYQLVDAVSDMLWYTIYFDPRPDIAEPMLAVLARLLPADDVLLVRMQGWMFIQQNKPDEAKVKLEAVADRDPLAVVGLIKLTSPTDAEGNNRGRKLLTDHPTGMLAAFVKDALRDRAIKVVAREDAAMVLEILNNFPTKFFDIIDNPKNFYGISGEAVSPAYNYREPMLVRVTLSNHSQFDITIGRGGILRPDVWLDARIHNSTQVFPGAAYDRMTQLIVLRPGQSVSQVIRIDQGPLGKMLAENPTQPFDIFVTAVTNPVPTEKGIGAGLGGYRVQLRKSVVREAFAVTADREVNRMLDNLVGGTKDRIANMDLMAAYMVNPDERIKKLAPTFEQKLVAVKVDNSASIRSWAQYTLAGLAAAPAKAQQVQEMARSADWQARLLAALRSGDLGPDSRKSVLTELSNDAEPAIKDYAKSMLETISAPPTTSDVKN
jgi:tetratricopeptide (TPR) repeat protein